MLTELKERIGGISKTLGVMAQAQEMKEEYREFKTSYVKNLEF